MHLGKICATYWDYARLATCLLATTLVGVFPYHAETEWLADLHKIDSRLLLLAGRWLQRSIALCHIGS